uniref:Uncharacterized protein n=1 Tax=Arundo donax TaxID=35708 RepID=A0A0A9HHI7_ARUDO
MCPPHPPPAGGLQSSLPKLPLVIPFLPLE